MSSLPPPLPDNEAEVTGPRLVPPPGLFVRLRAYQRPMTDGVGLGLRKTTGDGVQSKGRESWHNLRDGNYPRCPAPTRSPPLNDPLFFTSDPKNTVPRAERQKHFLFLFFLKTGGKRENMS